MKTIIATFASQNAAKEAEQALRDAGFDAVGIESQTAPNDVDGADGAGGAINANQNREDLPDDSGELVDRSGRLAEDAPLIGVAAVNNPINSSTPAPMAAPLIAANMYDDRPTRLTVKTDMKIDKAVKIITDHGGSIDTESKRSTLDEVANPAQARDRLK